MYMPGVASGPRENRVETRHKVFLLGTIIHDGRIARAHVLDLSHGGAQLHCADPPQPGVRVELMMGDFHVRGEVRWASRERFGIRFDHRLTLRRLDLAIA